MINGSAGLPKGPQRLILALFCGLFWGSGLGAQPSETPPAAPAEEVTPKAEPAEPPAKPPAEVPPVEALPAQPAEKPTEKSAEKLAIEQPVVEWNDAVAAVATKKAPEGVDDLRVLQKQVQQVLKHAMPATLGVQLGDAAGSAVIVSADGLVLTAGHVAGVPGREVNCYFPDGRRAKGITLGMNRAIDSGMIRLIEPGPWPHVEMADEAKGTVLVPGEWVVALGHAGGFDPRRTPPARLGRVLYQNAEILHTDCALVGGDSGGPLLNLRGELVGIHSRIGRRLTSNFHVPVGTYRQTWDRLVAGEVWGGRLDANEPVRYRPTLGIAVQNGDGSCVVTQVFPAGPSAVAGIQTGDVITKFGETEINSFDDLTELLWKEKPGNKVMLQLQREGKALSLEVSLGQIAQSLPGGAEPPEEEEQES